MAATASPCASRRPSMSVEQYWAPDSLPDALEHLRGGEVTILAGGTDLMPQSHAGRVTLQRGLLNIRRVPELHRIERDGAGVRIGALCTVSELMRDPLVRAHFGILRRGRRPFRQRSAAQRGDDRRQCLQCVAGRRPAGPAARAGRRGRARVEAERDRGDPAHAARGILRRAREDEARARRAPRARSGCRCRRRASPDASSSSACGPPSTSPPSRSASAASVPATC